MVSFEPLQFYFETCLLLLQVDATLVRSSAALSCRKLIPVGLFLFYLVYAQLYHVACYLPAS